MTGPAPPVSLAPLLPAPAAPPHDPRRLPLGPIPGWRARRLDGLRIAPDGSLALAPPPAADPPLTAVGGTLGGLTLPPNVLITGDGGLILLDRGRGLLEVLDRCACRLLPVPFTGGLGDGPRRFAEPGGIALCGGRLLVADAGHARVSVFATGTWVLHGHWAPPPGATAQPWRPVDLVAGAREVLVADPNNGAIHRFARSGRWLGLWEGLGGLTRLAAGRGGRLYALRGPDLPALILHPATGQVVGEATLAHEVAVDFPPPPLPLRSDGRMDLSALCGDGAGPFWVDGNGNAIEPPAPVEPIYATAGTYRSEPLDSRLYRCQWDRLSLRLDLPAGSRVRVSTFTAETPLTNTELDALPPAAWSTDLVLRPGAPTAPDLDGLLRAPPGRYLWLRLELGGDGRCTPRLWAMTLDFPRITLRRYLPAVFGEEPESADFTDRFLAVFDRGLREVEREIDRLARYFDPLSAPAGPGRRDFLTWLAGWIGVTLDRQLPLPTRRRLVKQAGRLFACRGTVTGLRQMLSLYLGAPWTAAASGCAASAPCGPCTTRPVPAWQPPPLILEHFRLRRWLLLGHGRLGDDAVLWGQGIVNRSQLSGGEVAGNARTGVTRLDTSQDPLRDPFHVYAHRFTLFLPAWLRRRPGLERALERLVEAEKPAHTAHAIRWVEPRMRIGVQAAIGLDAVVGCWPAGVALAETDGEGSRLGRASVLAAAGGAGSDGRVGVGTRLR
jgi:phage tail-like protein